MARFIAIADNPNLTQDQFQEAFDAIRKWRFDRRAWIVKAYYGSDDGKVVVECEAPEQSQFEDWLRSKGWNMNGIHRVNMIHEAGSIWPV